MAFNKGITNISRKLFSAKKITPNRNLTLIGAPFSIGQTKSGAECTPSAFRQMGIGEMLTNNGYRVADFGGIKVPEQEKFLYIASDTARNEQKKILALGEMNKKLHRVVAEHYSKTDFLLTIGGDHSFSVGSVSGVLANDPNVGVIWVDAHADINTPDISQTGNRNGMTASYLLNLNDNSEGGMKWLDDIPPLKAKNIVYIGLRDVDHGQREILKKCEISCYTMEDVDNVGIKEVIKSALQDLSECERLHMSFDIDAMDKNIVPSSGTPVIGGLTVREANQIVRQIYNTGKLKSMDLAEVNSALEREVGDSKKTMVAAWEVLKNATGYKMRI